MEKVFLQLLTFLLPVCGLLAQDSLKAIGKITYNRTTTLFLHTEKRSYAQTIELNANN